MDRKRPPVEPTDGQEPAPKAQRKEEELPATEEGQTSPVAAVATTEQEEVDDLIATLEAAEDLLDRINHTFPDGTRLDSSRVFNQGSLRQFLASDSIALVQYKEVWGKEKILTDPLRYNPNNF